MKPYVLECHPALGGRTDFVADYRGSLLGPELEFFSFYDPLYFSAFANDITVKYGPPTATQVPDVLYQQQLAKPELSSTQFELSDGPFETLDAMRCALKVRMDAVQQHFSCGSNVVMPLSYVGRALDSNNQVRNITSSASVPQESGRYALLQQLFGDGFVHAASRVASDQINIGGKDEHDAFHSFNLLRTYLPLFAGFSVASPFNENGTVSDGTPASQRILTYMKAVSLSLGKNVGITDLIPPQLDNLADYTKMVNTFPIAHPNTIYHFIRPMPHRGVAAEIRIMDKQPSLQETLSLYAFSLGVVNSGIVRNISEPELAEEIEAAVHVGIYDKGLFINALQTAKKGLSADDQAYLTPLERRIMHGTVAENMVRLSYGNGLLELLETLEDCSRTDEAFV